MTLVSSLRLTARGPLPVGRAPVAVLTRLEDAVTAAILLDTLQVGATNLDHHHQQQYLSHRKLPALQLVRILGETNRQYRDKV